jgi:hypothetical protein
MNITTQTFSHPHCTMPLSSEVIQTLQQRLKNKNTCKWIPAREVESMLKKEIPNQYK